jgi:UPF0176 protein
LGAHDFREVYQLDGGVVRYGEQFANAGRGEGSLVVFDERQRVDFGDDVTVLGRRERCAVPTVHHHNCTNPARRALILFCEDCAVRHSSGASGPHPANAARAKGVRT